MQKKSPRHLARSLAVQGIYSIQMNHCTISEVEDFLSNTNNKLYLSANYELMHYLIENTMVNFSTNLELYLPFLNRSIEDINLIEKIILAIAATELLDNLSVPATVIINEAVELAKLYGAEESYKFINGLVDKLSHQLRKNEANSYLPKYKSK